MKIAFMGTPALAVPCLELLRAQHEIVVAVTQPDKIGGRGHKLLASPVAEYSTAHHIPVLQPESARDESFVAELQEFAPDAIAVVAYGQILPRAILDLPSQNFAGKSYGGGCVNLHFSLLPRWRGAAPVQYALLKGDTQTGVSTQWMAEKLDAGDIILQREIPISPDENAGAIFEKLTALGAQVLAETMRLMENGAAPRKGQNESEVTFAPTIKKEETKIDWSQNAIEIHNQIRAFNPRPGAWCEFRGVPLKIWRAQVSNPGTSTSTSGPPGRILWFLSDGMVVATGNGSSLKITEVQAAGKTRMRPELWTRGVRLQEGEALE